MVRPKGMNRYSNNPNGVMIAVFAMSERVHRNLMVSLHEIDAREKPTNIQPCGQVQDGREMVPGVYRRKIEPAIIAAWAPRTILLRDHVQW